MPADAVTVRLARPSDLRHVAAVEESGVPMFAEHLGDLMPPALAAPSPSGAARDQDGALLVAAAGDAVVGFAHVDRPGDDARWAHLQQLSVLPSWQRRGVGSTLVRAAMEEARWSGCSWLSLCTYRDLPWNGGFYRSLGFTEVADPEPFQRRLREAEAALGLDAAGPRVVMVVPLPRAGTSSTR